MKKTSLILATLLTSIGFASAANAQIISRTFNVVGTATENGSFHPSTVVSVFVDIDLNTYTVNFSNTTLGPGGYVGTITSFGFNTPFTNAELGTNGSNVSFTSTKAVQPTNNGWGIFDPYGLSQGGGIFVQDLGAGTGNVPEGGSPNHGIKFGETASFVFTLPDFTAATGFFDSAIDFTVRWQQVGLSTAPIGQRGGSDFGGADDLTPTPGDVPGSAVPEPSTYSAIAGLLLLGVAAKRRFLKKRA